MYCSFILISPWFFVVLFSVIYLLRDVNDIWSNVSKANAWRDIIDDLNKPAWATEKYLTFLESLLGNTTVISIWIEGNLPLHVKSRDTTFLHDWSGFVYHSDPIPTSRSAYNPIWNLPTKACHQLSYHYIYTALVHLLMQGYLGNETVKPPLILDSCFFLVQYTNPFLVPSS